VNPFTSKRNSPALGLPPVSAGDAVSVEPASVVPPVPAGEPPVPVLPPVAVVPPVPEESPPVPEALPPEPVDPPEPEDDPPEPPLEGLPPLPLALFPPVPELLEPPVPDGVFDDSGADVQATPSSAKTEKTFAVSWKRWAFIGGLSKGATRSSSSGLYSP
jgi:hypothetical protein